jgi:hypothetical protein
MTETSAARVWDFGFGFLDFLGIWDLGFGIFVDGWDTLEPQPEGG